MCEKKQFAQKFTDGQTDDRRRTIALADHSWNELKTEAVRAHLTTDRDVINSRKDKKNVKKVFL